jgi:hypothetical protein
MHEQETNDQARIPALLTKIRALEHELEAEITKRRAGLRYGIERGRVIFEQEILRRHRELKVGLFQYLRGARPLIALSAPVIYGMIIPILFLDACVSLYQAVCFPLYGIPKIRRRDYFVFDRAHLAYLNSLQKLNCAYCSYANGVFAYVREIGARTEAYWCPIKHARRVIGSHEHYVEFAEYGDADAFQKIAK